MNRKSTASKIPTLDERAQFIESNLVPVANQSKILQRRFVNFVFDLITPFDASMSSSNIAFVQCLNLGYGFQDIHNWYC